jgi:hypothetical protein
MTVSLAQQASALRSAQLEMTSISNVLSNVIAPHSKRVAQPKTNASLTADRRTRKMTPHNRNQLAAQAIQIGTAPTGEQQLVIKNAEVVYEQDEQVAIRFSFPLLFDNINVYMPIPPDGQNDTEVVFSCGQNETTSRARVSKSPRNANHEFAVCDLELLTHIAILINLPTRDDQMFTSAYVKPYGRHHDNPNRR